jgi:hypothetical protein
MHEVDSILVKSATMKIAWFYRSTATGGENHLLGT